MATCITIQSCVVSTDADADDWTSNLMLGRYLLYGVGIMDTKSSRSWDCPLASRAVFLLSSSLFFFSVAQKIYESIKLPCPALPD